MRCDDNMPVVVGRTPWWEAVYEQTAQAAAFLRKDLAIAVSYRLQFLFQFSQIFFSLAVIYFIGRMLESSGRPNILKEYSVDYFSFALVGLAANSYLKTGLVAITNDMRQTMNQGILEAMCASPVAYPRLLLFMSLWPFAFETIRVAFYFLLGILVFGMRLPQANWIGSVIVLLLTLPSFLMLGIASSSLLILVKKGDPINWFFTSVSGILAGTMFPIAVLPGWLRVVALCLPLTHALEAMRRCLLAGATFGDIQDHLTALLLFLVVLFPATVVINRVCMARARRTGAFSTY